MVSTLRHGLSEPAPRIGRITIGRTKGRPRVRLYKSYSFMRYPGHKSASTGRHEGRIEVHLANMIL